MALRTVLDEKEMGEIALKYVRRKLLNDSIPMNAEKIRREIGNTAKDLGIPSERAMQFAVQLLSPAFEKVLLDLSK